MHELGKVFLLLGVLLIVIGALLLLGPKVPLLGKLPGDLVIKRDNFTLYLPITTSIVLSILVSLLVYLINKFR
jgi:hypothetical protein